MARWEALRSVIPAEAGGRGPADAASSTVNQVHLAYPVHNRLRNHSPYLARIRIKSGQKWRASVGERSSQSRWITLVKCGVTRASV